MGVGVRGAWPAELGPGRAVVGNLERAGVRGSSSSRRPGRPGRHRAGVRNRIRVGVARRGARPVGIDNSQAQLKTARAFQREFGLEFPLLHGNAEDVPLPHASFDLAISEYGASIWCDPYRWIPEAARLLRPEGQLIFLTNGVLAMLTIPDQENGAATDRLLRPYFGMHRFEWSDDDSVEFHLPHGEMLALMRQSGFVVEQLLEIRPPDGSRTRYPFITLDWAQRWPCEEVWKARKLSSAPCRPTSGHN